MKRPVWFKASTLGSIPVRWTPMTWQGWAVIGLYLTGLIGGLSLHNSPEAMIVLECLFVALLIGIAARTDDRVR